VGIDPPVKDWNLAQLRTSAECVRQKSYAAAARAPPPVPADRLAPGQRLERVWRVALLERHGRELR